MWLWLLNGSTHDFAGGQPFCKPEVIMSRCKRNMMTISKLRYMSFLFILLTPAIMSCHSNSTDVPSVADSVLTDSASPKDNVLDVNTINTVPDESDDLTVAQQLRLDKAFSRLLKRIHHVKPHYPISCKEAGVQGSVILEIIIETDGTVNDHVKVLRGLDCKGMDEAAIEAVKQWLFEPIVFEGKPVTKYCTMTVKFSLD